MSVESSAYWRDVRHKAFGKPKSWVDWAESVAAVVLPLALIWRAFGRDKALEELETTLLYLGSAAVIAAVLVVLRLSQAAYEVHREDLQLVSRADAARETAQTGLESLRRAHARDAEWDRAIDVFQGLWNADISAVLTKTTREGGTAEHWSFHCFTGNLVPQYGDSEAHVRACETACRIAGHALSFSKTWNTLPPEITAHTDQLERWLHFVAWKDGLHGFKGSGYLKLPDDALQSWTTDSINEIARRSKRLCEDCRNSEVFL